MTKHVVAITGASGGIGAELAKQLAATGKYLVSICARREAQLKEVQAACGGADVCHYVVADVTVQADVNRFVAETVAKFGTVDVLVNNAGVGASAAPSQTTAADIDEMIRINVHSVLFGMQAVLPIFKETKKGQIVNVSSMLGRIPQMAPDLMAYSGAKHFVNALTAAFRVEVKEAGLTDVVVTLFSPGVIATEFGVHAKNSEMDNRQYPGAMRVEDCAAVIVQQAIVERKEEVYALEAHRAYVAQYYGSL